MVERFVSIFIAACCGCLGAVGALAQTAPLGLDTFYTQTYADNSSIQIIWTSNSETNLKFIAVESSPDGQNWAEISRMPTAPSVQTRKEHPLLPYRTLDRTHKNLPKNILLYRLVAIETHGYKSYSRVAFFNPQRQPFLHIGYDYARKQLQIQPSLPQKDSLLEIRIQPLFAKAQKTIFEQSLPLQQGFYPLDLPAGAYLCTYRFAETKDWIFKKLWVCP